ncbi:MAG: aminotransferase class I/II-fold pyridoxal phosphate-dependent enzyme [Steroidobacteraceae bacterium]
MKQETRVNHPPAVELSPDNRPLVAPIYQSVKFEFADTAETDRFLHGERPGFYYSRQANPTLRQLELLLSELQGQEACLLTASGAGAVGMCLTSLCKAGDHILAFIESYGPTRHIIQRILGRYGVTHTLLPIEDRAGIERVLATTPTRLVMFESPTNPVTKIADVAHLVGTAHAHGALVVMDNTFAGFHNHGGMGIDVHVHSLTKYASGHGDVMGGAILASERLIRSIRQDVNTLGATLDPHAAFLLQRGMRTYFLRYERQCANALQVARFLATHPRVRRVFYPGLPDHPQHALAARQMRDFGAVVSFDLDGGLDHGSRFADALQLFSTTPSLGSTESLVMPGRLLGGREFTPEQRVHSAIGPGTVRLSIGIEAATDLLADLAQALAASFG